MSYRKSSEIAPLLTLDFQENILFLSSFLETVLDTIPYHFGEFVNFFGVNKIIFLCRQLYFLSPLENALIL